MSDRSLAALQRIQHLAETIVYEAEGIEEELGTAATKTLLVAAQLLEKVANDFGGAA